MRETIYIYKYIDRMNDRMNVPAKSEAFPTLKNHKPSFRNNPTCRLINPNKSEVGRVSKVIIQNINNEIRDQINFNQWTNTADVIKWFNNIPNKTRCNFIKFDIVDFYPSITEDLLLKALEWAETFVDISDQDRKIIFTAKNSLLYSESQPWKKKD